MNIHEALVILEENQVTDSVQMLRRWIRQGKIKATMKSKKTGYIVDRESLHAFISIKKEEFKSNNKNVSKIVDDKLGTYEEGLKDGIRLGESAIREAIIKREKELILKGLKEDFIRYSITELLNGFSEKVRLKEHLILLEVKEVTLNVLGNWIYDEMFNILIDVNELAYPNRNLKTRVKKAYTQKLFEHLESNK